MDPAVCLSGAAIVVASRACLFAGGVAHEIQGTVVLSYRIAKDGSVQDTETVGGHPFLVIAAGGNLATWRFEPTSSGDEMRRVTYVFELADSGEARSEMKDSSFVRVIVPVPLLDPISNS